MIIIIACQVSYFSSLGPTFDGRIKPDVVAPGFKIVSAYSGDVNEMNCGVSEIQGMKYTSIVVKLKIVVCSSAILISMTLFVFVIIYACYTSI